MRVWSDEQGLSCFWPRANPFLKSAEPSVFAGVSSTSGASDSSITASRGCTTSRAEGANRLFPPDLARQLMADGITDSISASTVRRVLAHHKLKPWRHHMWLPPKHPRDAEFYAHVEEVIDLYTRPLQPYEIVLSVDENTSLQPRTRLHPTKPVRESVVKAPRLSGCFANGRHQRHELPMAERLPAPRRSPSRPGSTELVTGTPHVGLRSA